ncbi:MAG: alpha/beta fold hydrolase [Planctomycetota bacterium]
MLVWMETRLVYPGAFVEADARDWRSEAIGTESLRYTSVDGTVLEGRLVRRRDSGRHVLFFHGNGTKAVWSIGFMRRLAGALDASVFAPEYRGYGASDDHGDTGEGVRRSDHPTEARVVEDCIAAADAYCEKAGVSPEQVILYGSSLGGGCAAAVAQQRGARAVILERTFGRLVDVAAEKYWFLPVRWLMKNRFDSSARLAKYLGPVLQIHGDIDHVVPIQHARSLEATLVTNDHEFELVSGLGHNDFIDQETLARVRRWLDERE